MKFLALLLRYYSCAFSILLGAFLTGLATLIVVTNIQNLDMSMLPWWKGSALIAWLFALGLCGILAGGLALIRRAQWLLTLFSLAAFGIIVYGYFINTAYHFSGREGAYGALWFSLGALVAVIGSLFQFGRYARD